LSMSYLLTPNLAETGSQPWQLFGI
jgi:hypothetical protein